MNKRLKFLIAFAVILAPILYFFWEPITGFGMGTMSVAYKTLPEAERIRALDARRFTFDRTTITLYPQKALQKSTSVTYRVETYRIRALGFKTEKEFVDLIRPYLQGDPQEIYHVSIPSLTHSENTHHELVDAIRVWERLSEDRPYSCYSPNEIRQILPAALRPSFDQQVKEHPKNIWLDWPKDRRKLFLRFTWSYREQEYLLTKIALDYPNDDQGPNDPRMLRFEVQ